MSTGGLFPEEKLIVIVADLPLHAPHMRKMKKRHEVAPGRLPISPSMTKTLAEGARKVNKIPIYNKSLPCAALTAR
jgi:hypothetical protein